MEQVAYADLMSHWKQIEVLRSTVGLLYWDLETYMPEGSINLRQDQLSLCAQLEYNWLNDNKFKEAVLSDKVTPANDREKRNLQLWKKGIHVSSSVDAKFIDEFTRVTSECNMVWRTAREKSDYKMVLPIFKKTIELVREQYKRIKANPELKSYYDGKSLYEVAFDQYEPGMKLADMQTLLTNLCNATKEKLPAYLEKSKKNYKELRGKTDVVTKSFCESIMKDFGFNFTKGRLDTSTHPFSGGYPGDVRLTVRKKPVDPLEDLLSTLHEVGHALYDQGVPAETVYEPCGKFCSLGVHESQSRFIENMIGRSRAFSDLVAKKLNFNAEELYSALNPVKLGYIRVDSDEVTYNFHILLRHELEYDLIEGKMEAEDLPNRWNARLLELTGLKVEKDSQGCLQDTHWYSGSFGYFPTYSLGNMLSAELFQDFKKDHADWEDRVRSGELAFVRDFMGRKVYPHASKYDSPEGIQKILGRKLSEKALLSYFDSKFA